MITSLLIAAALAQPPTQPSAQSVTPRNPLDAYNLVWTSPTPPSQGAAGSMPIGNGETGLNVWVEEDGDLLFYISRTDAWSECDRLLKLGRVRISLSPNPFAKGQPFRQELLLREGRIHIIAGAPERSVDLSVYVDALGSDIRVDAAATLPIGVICSLECWRTERHALIDSGELQSSWTMRDAPADIRENAWESPDIIETNADAITWCHRNEHSIVPFTLNHQGLTPIAGTFTDTLLHRTFGGRMSSPQLHAASGRPTTLAAPDPVKSFNLRITTHAARTGTIDQWKAQLLAAGAKSPNPEGTQAANAAWWSAFWDRSWIFVDEGKADPSSPSRVTQSYILQRWINACGGRGRWPIKFNGSIFTVEPRPTEGQPFNPDWRKWGGCFWWQNTRLPYYPMLAAGDFDMMDPLFRFYETVLPGCKARAKLYYNAEGVYLPETITSFGTYANGDYGWSRDGRPPSEVDCPWWQWAWNQSLELTQIMLDYASYSGDERFLSDRAIPMARETLRYFDSRFTRDDHGILLITPTQAVETYWRGVVNDAPSVAGLRAISDMLLALPDKFGSPEDRALWKRMHDACPPLPLATIDGKTIASPAEKFDPHRNNVETPELYPLWPFRLYGLGRPNLDAAIRAYERRTDRSTIGWTQDGLFAAMLGLTDQARDNLLARTRNCRPQFRFPAMWGPNFDWLPDQCHGGNLMSGLQLMLMQCDGDTIRMLPAWPKEWNASFKLHAPKNTIVQGRVEGGKLIDLQVTPESRRKDVIVGSSP